MGNFAAIVKKTFKYGGRTVSMQTGEIARQTTASVMIDIDGTSVLVCVVGAEKADKARDFFPLTVKLSRKSLLIWKDTRRIH